MGDSSLKRGLCLAAAVMIIALVRANDQASANNYSVKGSSSQCGGSMQDCLVEDDVNAEFWPEYSGAVSSSLAAQPPPYVKKTFNFGAAVFQCGKVPYTPCLPQSNKYSFKKPNRHCSVSLNVPPRDCFTPA